MIQQPLTEIRGNAKRGFALVIALSLMAFVLLLILSLQSLIRVEVSVSANTKVFMQAQQNALTALQVSLGELQKVAGPDQRVTARAEILDGNPYNPAEDIEGVKQPYWTGVWTTGPESLDVGTNPQRVTSLGGLSSDSTQKAATAVWLVSRDNDPSILVDPLTWSGNSVTIATDVGENDSDVEVPLLQITGRNGTPEGGLAYWVSDEGVKAKLNLSDPDFGNGSLTQAQRQLRSWSSAANAMQAILPVASSIKDFRETPTSELEKLKTPDSVALLATIDNSIDVSEIQTDFTLHSYGVMADVRNGGLKQDLTATFEDATNFQAFAAASGNGQSMLYRARTNAFPALSPSADSLNTPDGLTWFSLFYYYNTYKDLMASPISSALGPVGIANPDNALPYSLPPRGYATLLDGTSIRTGAILPETISFRVDIAISSYNDTTSGSGNNWKLRLHYYPQMVLYNPYSVSLSLENFAIMRHLNPWGVGASNRPGITGTVGSTAVNFKLNSYADISSADFRFPMSSAAGETNLLLPGETRVYGLDQDRLIANSDFESAIEFLDLVSNSNMSADFSQIVDVPGFAGTPNGDAIVDIDTFTGGSATVERSQVFSLLLGPHTETYWPSPIRATERFVEGARFPNGSVSGTWTPRKISTLQNSPVHLRGIFVRWKGLRSTGSVFALPYENANVTPPVFMGNSPQTAAFDQTFFTTGGETYIRTFGEPYLGGQTVIQIQPATNGTSWETSFGNSSAGFDNPGDRRILREIPTQPLSSLGQFMHMSATSWAGRSSYQALDVGSMFVGGSIPNPILPSSVNAADPIPGNSSSRLVLDDSFLANEALFDRYFLSTVPPATLAGGTAWPQAWRDFNSANSGSTLSDASLPLLNPRMSPRTDIDVRMDDLRDPQLAAANLLLNGAFNVNSTSVPAWKAFLGSKAGNTVQIYNATTTLSQAFDPGDDFPIPRFWSATGNLNNNDPWNGLRVLDETALTRLAEEVVEQVKLRGPFLSFADFLNRRLVSSGEFARTGALQAAIDHADLNDAVDAQGEPLNINDIFVERFQANIPVISQLMDDAKGDRRSSAVGTPGYLMQQDLVQNFAANMAIRSDTFVIRCYGESRNSVSGEINAKAWGEAVVQRLPDFLNPEDTPETVLDSLTRNVNQTFGRRFKIVSFNWLDADQI